MSTGPTPETRRIAFRIEYDGTGFHGWQSQPDCSPTVQGTLEAALQDFFGVESAVQGASRTDAGVHARDQLAAVTIRHPIGLDGFAKAVNNRLPKSIAIRSPRLVEDDFNPRFGNRSKTYSYRLYSNSIRHPLIDRFAWRIPWSLDLESMAQAASRLIGTHDFTSFAAADGSHLTTERSIYAFDCSSDDTYSCILRVRGNAFMKNMVRILVGTLVEVGRGRLTPIDVVQILESKDRQAAGPTAPPRGLELTRIYANFEPEQGDAVH